MWPFKKRHDWAAHYKALFERSEHDRDRYKAMCFDAWKTMSGQTRGLQRQARKIKRLRAELDQAKTALEETNEALR